MPRPTFPGNMSAAFPAALAGLIVAAGTLGACAHSAPSTDPRFRMGDAAAVARASADSMRYPYTNADVEFMTGMIHHHAQAITISRWAVSHGATPAVQRLTARIINAQTDEIKLMRTWLGDRLQPAPQVDSTGNVTMPGMSHTSGDIDFHAGHGAAVNAQGQMEMPGMLTAAQLKELDAARGPEFDRLFLSNMIQHHRGAVEMVKTLFAAPGAGQDETTFKFANDVEVDQSTEIRRMMTLMLDLGFVPPMI